MSEDQTRAGDDGADARAGRRQRRPGEPSSADPVVKDPTRFDPRRPIERELETSVRDGFALTAVGDCIITRPL